MMKKIILYTLIIILTFSACEKMCKSIKPPKDLKAIDWENYNDVYTVYGNFHTLCSETKEKYRDREILVCGWIWEPLDGGISTSLHDGISTSEFYLMEDLSKARDEQLLGNLSIPILYYGQTNEELQIKFDTSNLTKKCFVIGKLRFNCLHSGLCSKTYPVIVVNSSSDNIYFESERRYYETNNFIHTNRHVDIHGMW
jgi:hypothetical protein